MVLQTKPWEDRSTDIAHCSFMLEVEHGERLYWYSSAEDEWQSFAAAPVEQHSWILVATVNIAVVPVIMIPTP